MADFADDLASADNVADSVLPNLLIRVLCSIRICRPLQVTEYPRRALACRGQIANAHRVVLASSIKIPARRGTPDHDSIGWRFHKLSFGTKDIPTAVPDFTPLLVVISLSSKVRSCLLKIVEIQRWDISVTECYFERCGTKYKNEYNVSGHASHQDLSLL